MSILTENSRKMLVESMRECLSDVLHESTSLTSKQATEKIKFVTESATYEQLLNITMNPHRQEKYQPAYVLEGAVAILHSACMTGRKVIGPNAITEGALKLHKKTGAVITESMLDAALTAATEGCGLKVVGKILSEAALDPAMQQAINDLINYQANASKSGVAINMAGLRSSLSRAGIQDPINVIKQVENGVSPLRAVAASRTALRLDSIKASLKSGKLTPDAIKFLRSKGAPTGLTAGTPLTPQLRALLTGYQTQLGKNAARHAGDVGNYSSNAFKNLANSGAGKTPWGKIALGAAALGGAGALGWKYWKNKQAMQRDMQNGIPQQ